jgi:hypothetical protein
MRLGQCANAQRICADHGIRQQHVAQSLHRTQVASSTVVEHFA